MSAFFEPLDIEGNRRKWDQRFLEMAKLVGSWSKDPSTQTGAVIVDIDKSVVSVGYNGFPRPIRDLPERYLDREVKYSMVVHAEMNAILSAGRNLIGTTLYLHPFMPCDRCAVHVIQAGIQRVVAPMTPEDKLERWAKSMETTSALFLEAGVILEHRDFE